MFTKSAVATPRETARPNICAVVRNVLTGRTSLGPALTCPTVKDNCTIKPPPIRLMMAKPQTVPLDEVSDIVVNNAAPMIMKALAA